MDSRDFSHLFLGDETINDYMDLITERSPDSVYAFNTFFFSNLVTRGYSHMSRWTKKVDIFGKRKLFFPIHLEKRKHWCLVCVDFAEKSIKYYDSLGGGNFVCLKRILKYLTCEHVDKKGVGFDPNGYRLINMADCPRQHNGWDCGVFVCTIAEFLSRDEPLTSVTQAGMKRFRRQINYDVGCKKSKKTA